MDGFFGIGFGELVLIAIVALVVLGPERLPGALREVAKFIRMVRNLTSEFTDQFGDEFKALEDLNPRRLLQEAIDDIDEEERAKEQKPAAKQSTKAKSTTSKSATTKSTSTKTSSTPKPTTAKNTAAKATDTAAAELSPAVTDADSTTAVAEDAASEAVITTEVTAGGTPVTENSLTESAGAEMATLDDNQIAPPELVTQSDPVAENSTTPEANKPSPAVEPTTQVAQTNGHAVPTATNSSGAKEAAANVMPESQEEIAAVDESGMTSDSIHSDSVQREEKQS